MRALLKKYGKYIGYTLFTLLMIVYFLFLTCNFNLTNSVIHWFHYKNKHIVLAVITWNF